MALKRRTATSACKAAAASLTILLVEYLTKHKLPTVHFPGGRCFVDTLLIRTTSRTTTSTAITVQIHIPPPIHPLPPIHPFIIIAPFRPTTNSHHWNVASGHGGAHSHFS